MTTAHQLTDYLSEQISDPVQKFIFASEIIKCPPSSREYAEAYDGLMQSKWYSELASDQKADGSWGSAFHGGNVSSQNEYKFPCTEAAIRRARELGLPKDDPIILKCIGLLESYILRETRPPVTIEDYHERSKDESPEAAAIRTLMLRLPKNDPDIIKSLNLLDEYIRRETPPPVEATENIGAGFGFAANLNMLDPGNPLVSPFQKNAAETYGAFFIDGRFSEEAYFDAENEGSVYILAHPRNAFSIMLMRGFDFLDKAMQRHFYSYVWGKTETIRMDPKKQRKNKKHWIVQNPDSICYMSDFLPVSKKVLEEKDFTVWLSLLELVSGYSLFSEFMKEEAYEHLLGEAGRLIAGGVILPAPKSGHVVACGHQTNGRYAENWRDKEKRKTDMVLRIARLLAKC